MSAYGPDCSAHDWADKEFDKQSQECCGHCPKKSKLKGRYRVVESIHYDKFGEVDFRHFEVQELVGILFWKYWKSYSGGNRFPVEFKSSEKANIFIKDVLCKGNLVLSWSERVVE